MTIQEINIGTAPNDDTGDDPRTAGQKLNSNFTTSSHAASREVGIATGNIPDADDLSMVGAGVNWTDTNLNYSLFDGSAGSVICVDGVGRSATTADFYFKINRATAPSGIIALGTFSVSPIVFGATRGSGLTSANLAFNVGLSSSKEARVQVTGLSGVITDERLVMQIDTGSSSIEVI